jgi:hypothetical protein
MKVLDKVGLWHMLRLMRPSFLLLNISVIVLRILSYFRSPRFI